MKAHDGDFGGIRTLLVRTVAEVLSADTALTDLWPQCCALLSRLTEAPRVTIVLREADGDRIAFAWHEGQTVEPDGPVPVGSAMADTLRFGDTVVHERAAAVVMRFGPHVLGAIGVEGAPIDPERVTLLESCALFAATRVHREALVRSTARYEQLALTDALTGLPNRRRFDEALRFEWRRAMRDSLPVTVLMMDVDYFKLFNETYGRQAGDLCLQQVARALVEGIKRPADLVARYGGEEFVALLPGTDAAGGMAVAEAVLERVSALGIAHEGSSLAQVSLSIGVATVVPAEGAEAETLLRIADRELHEAKRGGRNRCCAEGLWSHGRPLTPSGSFVPNNLPLQLTRLLGRSAEVSHVKAHLVAGRLVTISGVAGSGKSRVALQAGTELLGNFADGVWFVDLSALTDAELIPSTIAALFARPLGTGVPAITGLLRLLARKHALLIFDNAEHVRQPAGELAVALLAACPGLRILTTSREPFDVAGETVYRLALLSLPATATIDAPSALRHGAVALFVERAKAAKATFVLADENAGTVVEICRLAEGNALAVELAAARLRTMALEQLREHLTHRMRVFRSGEGMAPEQRQALRALIEWSYELLTDAERLVFRRLAIFAGGCTLQAVREVCCAGEFDGGSVSVVLAGLVRTSMLLEELVDGTIRYRLVASTRENAAEKLAQAGETERLTRRHAAYFLGLAREAGMGASKGPSSDWYFACRADLENFRAALRWSLRRRADVGLGVELAANLVNVFDYCSASEGLRWTELAIDLMPAGSDPAIEARLQLGIAAGAPLPAVVRRAVERAVSLYRQLDDKAALVQVLRLRGNIQARFFPAERDEADASIAESIELARATGDLAGVSFGQLARCDLHPDWDVAKRRAIMEEALVLCRVYGTERQMSVVLARLGRLEFDAGDLARALSYGRDSVRCAEILGDTATAIAAQSHLAHYAVAAHDWLTASRAVEQLLRTARETGSPSCVTSAAQALAGIAAGAAECTHAARLLGFCRARLGTLHAAWAATSCEERVHRDLLAALRAELGEAELARALAEGALLTEDTIAREASL